MRRVLVAVVLVAVLAGMAAAVLLRPKLTAAERGRRIAEQTGCFTCHGPGGYRGAANPGRTDETVPNFEGDRMMYAETREDIRAWIRDGVTEKRRESQTWQEERRRGALRMPAFKDRLAASEIDDLVAYVMATSGLPAPDDPLAAQGLARVEALGCVGCHGAGGRLGPTNPGSLKGYVPSWDGADFAELVRDRAEFDEWVSHGVSERLRGNPLARYFLKRAILHMPAYEKHLEPGDLDAMWAYVTWLRSESKTRPSGRTAQEAP